MNKVSYSCTALMGTNKAGVLKPDEAGYYPLILGGLDVFNSAGAFYPLGPAKELFDSSSTLQRRIRSGNLRGEYGHPKINGMNSREFMSRVLEIREENVCCHIREVTLLDGVKDRNGRASVAIMGWVKPSGPMGNPLGESLENRHENVCFSIRSLTVDEYVRGVLTKTLKTVVTWDYVNEPGIAIANKYDAPTLEHLNELVVTPTMLAGIREQQRVCSGMGLESGSVISAAEIEETLGWRRGSISANPSTRW